MPGTSFGDPYAIHKVDTFLDLVLIYEEVLRKLGLKRPVAIGQSFGGMLMCDLAAHFPDIFSKIIPLDPAGLWRELDNFSSGSICFVLASHKYDENDYFRDYEKFTEWKSLK